MKVAFIISALNDKGPNRVAISLGRHLSELGHNVTFIYFDHCNCLDLFSDLKAFKVGFWDQIKLSSYDVVHSHMLRADAFVFIHKPIFCQTKFFSTAHCYLFEELLNYYSKFFAFFVSCLWMVFWFRFDRICVLTEHAFTYYKSFGFSKLSVCYNGRDIDLNEVLVDEKCLQLIDGLRNNNDYVIGTYCNLIVRKNVDILIRHVSRAVGSSLVVVGDGPDKPRLLELAKNLNVGSRVLFLAFQPEAHRFNKYFDVYAIPSQDEGFGLALVEAALNRQRIICSDIPVFREMFNDSCVSFFDLSSEDSFDNAVLLALEDHSKSEVAHARAKDLFSVHHMTRSYLNVYGDTSVL